MRQSNKPRIQRKGNRRPNVNVINRVYESSGPEGKVRGNPQQIIDKYQALSRDAVLAGDRVLAENYNQHAEHFVRLLGEANREIEARRATQNHQHSERSNGSGKAPPPNDPPLTNQQVASQPLGI